MNVQFRRYYLFFSSFTKLINFHRYFLGNLSALSKIIIIIKKKKRWDSIEISQLPNVYAASYFLKKLIDLLKGKGKFFDLLKPKS